MPPVGYRRSGRRSSPHGVRNPSADVMHQVLQPRNPGDCPAAERLQFVVGQRAFADISSDLTARSSVVSRAKVSGPAGVRPSRAP